METLKAIVCRKSVRNYTGEGLCKEELDSILRAAWAAPVGMGEYGAMHLTVITNKELLNDIDKNGAEFFGDPQSHPLYGAPVLIVVSAKADLPTDLVSANAGTIVENMALAATDMELGSVCIWGAMIGLKSNESLLAKLQLPEGFSVVGALAVGVTEEIFTEREIPENRIEVTYI